MSVSAVSEFVWREVTYCVGLGLGLGFRISGLGLGFILSVSQILYWKLASIVASVRGSYGGRSHIVSDISMRPSTNTSNWIGMSWLGFHSHADP